MTVPSPGAPVPRDPTIDILRGLAIAMMVFGHLAIEIVVPPGAFYIEALGGCAPAVFLMVSGMMVAYGVRWRDRPRRHFLLRGAQVVAVAAALDLLLWRIVPFTTVDILYLIGIAVPAAALAAARLPGPAVLALAAVVILATPPLQGFLGYTDWPTEIPLGGEAPEVIQLEGVGPVRVENPTSILNHWIIDGWFPVFPWVGFALLGAALSWLRWPAGGGGIPEPRPFSARNALLPGAVLLAIAFGLGWWDVEWELTLRRRWGGAFMPPGWDYLLGSAGTFLVLGWIADRAPEAPGWRPLRLLGANALLTYLAHFAALRIVSALLPARVEHPVFWGLYAIVLSVLVGLAAGWMRVRARTKLAPPSG